MEWGLEYFSFGVFINDINATSQFVNIIPLSSNKQSPPHQSLIIIQSCLRSSIHNSFFFFFAFLKIVWVGEEAFLGDLKWMVLGMSSCPQISSLQLPLPDSHLFSKDLPFRHTHIGFILRILLLSSCVHSHVNSGIIEELVLLHQ